MALMASLKLIHMQSDVWLNSWSLVEIPQSGCDDDAILLSYGCISHSWQQWPTFSLQLSKLLSQADVLLLSGVQVIKRLHRVYGDYTTSIRQHKWHIKK